MTARKFRIVTAAAGAPITVDEVKAHARVDGSTDDTILGEFIDAAVEVCEAFTRRRVFMQRTVEELWDDAPSYSGDVTLRLVPPVAIAQVATYADDGTETVFSSANYALDPYSNRGHLYLRDAASAWPTVSSTSGRNRNGFAVRYVAGYGASGDDVATQRAAVPEAIRRAVAMTAAHLYENREGQGAEAVMEFGATGGNRAPIDALPPGARLALAPYVVHDLRDLDA